MGFRFCLLLGRLSGTGIGVDVCVGASVDICIDVGVDVCIGVAAHLDHGQMGKGTCHFCHTCGLFQFIPHNFLS